MTIRKKAHSLFVDFINIDLISFHIFNLSFAMFLRCWVKFQPRLDVIINKVLIKKKRVLKPK